MKSVLVVAGARPNFVKVAPILRAARGATWAAVLIHTGQHYDFDMSGVFFEQLGIQDPAIHLQVGSASHGVQTGRIMIAFEEYLSSLPVVPAGIVVVGDVNSTMACALVGAKRRIPVAHVEAGLRSFDRDMPEEINRVVTDAVADLLLVSEPAGLENLEREGHVGRRVKYVGNVMIDSLVSQLEAARALAVHERFKLTRGAYALVTLHRPSNVDDTTRLAALCTFLLRIAERMPIVFPVHPRTARRLEDTGLRSLLSASNRVRLCEPLGYREFLSLMDAAGLALSDSGGIQEETSFLRIPCITLRTSTERPVTVTSGTNSLVGDDLEAAWALFVDILSGRQKTGKKIDGWDGCAASRVVSALNTAWFNG